MSRVPVLVYGLVVYALFAGTFLYAIGFVTELLVPKTINSGTEVGPVRALLVNVLLMSLFAVQHSIMARQWFKKWWTRIIPPAAERSTFVLLTCVILGLLFWFWSPLPAVVWEVTHPVLAPALWVLCWVGWAIALASTCIIDHFDLFGVRQVVLYARGKPYLQSPFKVASFYRHVRHPLMLGFMIAFWATPHMTVGRLLFAAVTTAYMLVAIQLEERDLAKFHGDDYREYRRRVPMLIPFLGRGPLEPHPADLSTGPRAVRES